MQLGTFRCIEGQKLHAQDILTKQTIPIDILHLSLSITNQILKKSEKFDIISKNCNMILILDKHMVNYVLDLAVCRKQIRGIMM